MWVWDAEKDRLNRQRHDGLALQDGIVVLDGDPLARSRPDPHPDGDREQTIGRAAGVLTLVVIHTERDDLGNGRIISVRRATSHERRCYEQGEF